MIVYGLKTCDTCRKALRALADAGHAPALRDVRAEPLSAAELESLLATFGDALLNRRSTTWRALTEAEQARPVAALLSQHPALMKRPVVATAGRLWLGWGPEVQAALL